MRHFVGCMLLLLFFIPAYPAASLIPPGVSSIHTNSPLPILKKPTLKQKIALLIFRHQLRKQRRRHPERVGDPGQIVFVIGLASLLCLLLPVFALVSLPLAIIAISAGVRVRKSDPHNRKARKGIILGIITIGLIMIVSAFIILLLAGAPR